jgi:hypothetical protein
MRWTAPHKASGCRRVIVDDGRDRNRPRLAVGKGFPSPLFRLRNGFTVSPWRTFAEAPLESRTARFPGSGSKPWRVTIGLPKAWRGLNAGSYPPPPVLVCLQPRLLEPSSAYVPVLSSRPPRRPRNNDFSQASLSRLQIFRDVPASKFARPPDRSYRCDYCRRAAGASTSGPIVLRCLHTLQIC